MLKKGCSTGSSFRNDLLQNPWFKKEVGKSEKRKASESSSPDSYYSAEEETFTPKIAKIDCLQKEKNQPSLGKGMYVAFSI